MTIHRLDVGSRSDVGFLRERNEDAYAALPAEGVVVVADGMGGHRGGERASRIAVDAALQVLTETQRVDRNDDLVTLGRVAAAIEAANKAIMRAAAAEPALTGMGTTLVLGLFRDRSLFFAHVGDSRLYRYRNGRLRQLTRDHSLIQQLVDEGLFANRREAQNAGVGDNVLLRSLGLEAQVEPDVGDARIEPHDLYLFCTDGLAGKVPDEHIETLLAGAGHNLDLLAERLKQAALDVGGPDNVTLVVARPRL